MHRLWYLEINGEVKGPFPAKQIRQYLLLGRFHLHQRVSPDGDHWLQISEVDELVPPQLEAGNATEYDLTLARRNADERTGLERRDEEDSSDEDRERRTGEDRRYDDAEDPTHRRFNPYLLSRFGVNRRLHLLIVVLLSVAWLLGFLTLTDAPVEHEKDCAAPPNPGVNWNHCVMSRRNLEGVNLEGAILDSVVLEYAVITNANLDHAKHSYADYTGADFTGSTFRQADLAGTLLKYAKLNNADFEGANLRYADLVGAAITGTSFAGANLEYAIWINKEICQPGSIGKCIAE